jgi:hypothetical protein
LALGLRDGRPGGHTVDQVDLDPLAHLGTDLVAAVVGHLV